jgi:hypothetical protein
MLDHTLHSPEEHSQRQKTRDPSPKAKDSKDSKNSKDPKESASSTSSSSSDSDNSYDLIASAEDITEKDGRRPRLHLDRFRTKDHRPLTKKGQDVEQGITRSRKVYEWWYEKTSLLTRVSLSAFPLSFLLMFAACSTGVDWPRRWHSLKPSSARIVFGYTSPMPSSSSSRMAL